MLWRDCKQSLGTPGHSCLWQVRASPEGFMTPNLRKFPRLFKRKQIYIYIYIRFHEAVLRDTCRMIFIVTKCYYFFQGSRRNIWKLKIDVDFSKEIEFVRGTYKKIPAWTATAKDRRKMLQQILSWNHKTIDTASGQSFSNILWLRYTSPMNITNWMNTPPFVQFGLFIEFYGVMRV